MGRRAGGHGRWLVNWYSVPRIPGSRVFVCDNLAFNGEHVIRRKHTVNARRELPGLVAEVVEPLREQRIEQAQTFDMYRATALRAKHVD